MTHEKTLEIARDISDTARELAFDDCEAEARLLDRKLARDPNVSNDHRAELVCDCFVEYAEGIDLSTPTREFIARFPEFG
jgi:hypothetical protein